MFSGYLCVELSCFHLLHVNYLTDYFLQNAEYGIGS